MRLEVLERGELKKGGGSEVEKDLKELGRMETAGKIWGWEEWR